MSFPRLYAVVTMETVQKRGSYLILIVVAAGFSSFLGGVSLTVTLELGILTSLRITVTLGKRLEQTVWAYRSHPDLSIVLKYVFDALLCNKYMYVLVIINFCTPTILLIGVCT